MQSDPDRIQADTTHRRICAGHSYSRASEVGAAGHSDRRRRARCERDRDRTVDHREVAGHSYWRAIDNQFGQSSGAVDHPHTVSAHRPCRRLTDAANSGGRWGGRGRRRAWIGRGRQRCGRRRISRSRRRRRSGRRCGGCWRSGRRRSGRWRSGRRGSGGRHCRRCRGGRDDRDRQDVTADWILAAADHCALPNLSSVAQNKWAMQKSWDCAAPKGILPGSCKHSVAWREGLGCQIEEINVDRAERGESKGQRASTIRRRTRHLLLRNRPQRCCSKVSTCRLHVFRVQ